jgi:hypothetical protein
MLHNHPPTYEEQAEGQVWQDVMREAVQQAAQMEAEKRAWFQNGEALLHHNDATHHLPARRSAPKNEEQERQPAKSTVDKVMKKPAEKKRCGWPGMR